MKNIMLHLSRRHLRHNSGPYSNGGFASQRRALLYLFSWQPFVRYYRWLCICYRFSDTSVESSTFYNKKGKNSHDCLQTTGNSQRFS
jgi:hypothetical protein